MFAYCCNNPVIGYDPTGEFWKDIGNWFKKLGTPIVQNEVQLIYDSVTVDVGIGLSAECAGFKSTGMVRSDFVTVRKDAGDEFYFGRADEAYLEVKAAFCSFFVGNKDFYNFDGNDSIGISAYFLCIGFTANVGFDFDYYFTNKFFK